MVAPERLVQPARAARPARPSAASRLAGIFGKPFADLPSAVLRRVARRSTEVPIEAAIYWFNDMDWHGVHADPWFRYSVRVDGVFEPGFLEGIRRAAGRR
jgi:hypothetical protein